MRILDTNDLLINNFSVGGKVKGLMLLKEKGLNVPEFFVLNNELLLKISKNHFLLEQIINQWKQKYNFNPFTLWSVRSSAGNEDGLQKSFAGQYQTKLNVSFEQLPNAILQVLKSYSLNTVYSEIPKNYGIIIQRMVKADYSGILFSKNPILPYKNDVVLKIIKGLGEQLVSGEQEGETVRVSKDNQVVHDTLQNLLQQLVDQALKLEKELKYAVDIEFAIENNQLFWLQLRPITTRKIKESVIVWDNTSVEANFQGLTLPLTVSFVTTSYGKAYYSLGKYLGVKEEVLQQNKCFFNKMTGEINGQLFYNVTAWQSLLYLLPFGEKFAINLPKLWGMDSIEFSIPSSSLNKIQKIKVLFRLFSKTLTYKKAKSKYLINHNRITTTITSDILKTKSINELKEIYNELESKTGGNWIAPVLNGILTMIFHVLLKKSLKNSKLLKLYPNFQNDILFSNNTIISVKMVNEFQYILKLLSKNETAKNIFKTNNSAQILMKIQTETPNIYSKIMAYINQFGNKLEGELKLETITFKQDKLLFIDYLKQSLEFYASTKHQSQQFNYNQILKEVYSINFFKRKYLKFLIYNYINRVIDRENYKFYRVDTFAIVRNVVTELGVRLKEKSIINSKKDVFYLTLQNLMADDVSEYKQIISSNIKKYKNYSVMPQLVNRYYEVKGNFYPELNNQNTLELNKLKGVGCCSGYVRGKVKVIDKNTNFKENFSDYILIANYFDPSWINIFYQAKGVISERGNLLSHTAIICRELNLPSIVGVKGLMKKLKNNDLISMDGALGIIEKLND